MIRKILSLLLLMSVGATIGGISAGLLTFYVYFIGMMLGIPFGAAFGAGLGWRTPLRDSVILFVSFWGSWVIGRAVSKPIFEQIQDNPLLRNVIELGLPPGAAMLGLLLIYWPLRHYVPFEQRRTVALGMALVTVLYLIWQLYRYVYVWQP